jgi:hypothetical protein
MRTVGFTLIFVRFMLQFYSGVMKACAADKYLDEIYVGQMKLCSR